MEMRLQQRLHHVQIRKDHTRVPGIQKALSKQGGPVRQGGRGHPRVGLDHPLCSGRPAPFFCCELRVSPVVVPVEALWVRRARDGRAVSERASRPGRCPASPLGPSCRPVSCLAHFLFLMTWSLGNMQVPRRGARGPGRWPASLLLLWTDEQEDSLPETRDWASRSKDLIKTSCRAEETRREGRGRDSPGQDGALGKPVFRANGTKSSCAPGSVLLAAR